MSDYSGFNTIFSLSGCASHLSTIVDEGERHIQELVKSLFIIKEEKELPPPESRKLNEVSSLESEEVLQRLRTVDISGCRGFQFMKKVDDSDIAMFKYVEPFRRDLARIMQTRSGRRLMFMIQESPRGFYVQVQHSIKHDFADPLSAYDAYADVLEVTEAVSETSSEGYIKIMSNIGSSAAVAYYERDNDQYWSESKPYFYFRTDVKLYHELCHAYHSFKGLMVNKRITQLGIRDLEVWFTNTDIEADRTLPPEHVGIRLLEYQATGLLCTGEFAPWKEIKWTTYPYGDEILKLRTILGFYRTTDSTLQPIGVINPLYWATENQYRAERRKIAEGSKGVVGTLEARDHDSKMVKRLEYGLLY